MVFADTNVAWCSTCGDDVDLDEVDSHFDCRKCQQWWEDNPPPKEEDNAY